MLSSFILKPDLFQEYITAFNRNDKELYAQYFSNTAAGEFLEKNIPLFECPDKKFEEIYYFRWWTYRKHIKSTSDGFVITEFLPSVVWSGKHNTISCAAGHHLYEGRWLHDSSFLDDYSTFWFRKGGEPRRYSFWAADAMWARYLVNSDKDLITDLLTDLCRNWKEWENTHCDPCGLFQQIDDRDGMEISIGGNGYRATINSYQYGDAVAIAKIAKLADRTSVAETYRKKAARIKKLVRDILWDKRVGFFKVLSREPGAELADVCELHGYTPWYFNLPDAGESSAWRYLMDKNYFYAPFGPTTAEQQHPQFELSYSGHQCQWNGPSWPYSTAVTLTAMANLLNNYHQTVVSKRDYFNLLGIYTKSHRLEYNERILPWIDENLNPYTGDWISRTRLKTWRDGDWDPDKGGEERGKDYNHSSYCDLIITGLVGLRPREDNIVEVNPLVPENTWPYFCLDNIRYHGLILTIIWDESGKKYEKGKGLRIFADGNQIAFSEKLSLVKGKL